MRENRSNLGELAEPSHHETSKPCRTQESHQKGLNANNTSSFSVANDLEIVAMLLKRTLKKHPADWRLLQAQQHVAIVLEHIVEEVVPSPINVPISKRGRANG